MKKIFSFLIFMLLLFNIAGCSPASEPEPSVAPTSPPISPAFSDADWKALYTDFILDANEYLKNQYPDALQYINVTDLTLDGVPELIISDTAASAANCIGILQIIGNEVKQVAGHSVSGLICSSEDVESGMKSPYSTFDAGWLTLRQNKETGQLQFLIKTQNGSSESSFGEIYSIGTDSSGIITFTELFQFENYTDDTVEDQFTVKGETVSESEYNTQLENYMSLWVDTGYATKGMHLPAVYSKLETYVPLSTEAADLRAFFEMYAPAQL